MDIDKLNKEQQKAVLTTEGPLLVLAGAGSGKTKVLTTKVAYLIEEKKVEAASILAITFTNKAANEMKSRIIDMVGEKAKHAQISTFHSFGLRILRENYKLLDYKSNFLIMDSDDSLSIVKKILKEKDLDVQLYNPTVFKNKISSAKNELVGPNEYHKYARGDLDKVFVDVYKKYEETLKKNNSVDFDDLLTLPLEIFNKNPNVLEYYQRRYSYVLIDEYQDTNEAQYRLSKMISQRHRNICCVGDNDQSIYSFRGANYQKILNFEKDFEDATVIKLEQNYRSTTNVLDAANSVIKNNRERKDKKLWSDKEKGDLIDYYRAKDDLDEADFVAKKIKSLLNEGYEANEITIIYRVNAQNSTFDKALIREMIPHKIIGGIAFLNRKEIKDLRAYLNLVYNEDDNLSLERVINFPKRGIGAKALEKLREKASQEKTNLFDALSEKKELEFKEIILKLKEIEKDSSVRELISKTIEISGMLEHYQNGKTLDDDLRLEKLEQFTKLSEEICLDRDINTLEDFLLEISLLSDTDTTASANEIQLMTVHAAKGLEFDCVFAVGLEESIFPHINSYGDPKELEEERRLFYVALTRAKKRLFLTNATMRQLHGRTQVNPPSRFIEEIDQEYINKLFEEEKPVEKIDISENYNEEKVDFAVGDVVIHDVFGVGKVTEVSDLLVVAFKHPYGIKKLSKQHKSIKKMEY